MAAHSLIASAGALSKALVLIFSTCAAVFGANSSPALEEKFRSLTGAMPPLQEHYTGPNAEKFRLKASHDAAYASIIKEKLERKWFAALITDDETKPLEVHGRFETWRGLLEFLQRSDAIVEIWAMPAAGAPQRRRIPAAEWDQLRRAPREQPHILSVTYRDANGQVVKRQIEFGFEAAQVVWETRLGYQRHRNLLLAANRILNARNDAGQFSASAQWHALTSATDFDLAEIPPAPGEKDSPFVAVEYAVDEHGNYSRPLRFFREEQIALKIEGDGPDARQVVMIGDGPKSFRRAEAYRARGVSDELEPARNSLPGQDELQLRVVSAQEADPRKWAALEFGGPALFKRAALAKFARMNAQMDRRRKEIAFNKTKLDLIAEPIIAGLNIGGGLAGVGLPLGEAVRIPYNIAAANWIAAVPTVAQMREIFALLAARELNPELRARADEFLTEADIRKLREAGRLLSDEEVQRYLATIDDSDIQTMTRLARMGMIDARVTNLLNLLTSVFKVSGASEQAGVLRDIFNNVRFAPNGDINLKSLLSLAVGKSIWTPLSGHSLENLGRGQGPAEAWAQFFEVSVDIRAVINSVSRWFKPTLAKKELEKPFPYATRLGDLAAYEFRAFGFPLLLFYKRGLIKADLEAYENDYAYGVIGTKIVERFSSKQDFEKEILAGNVFPLGLVKTPDGKGGWKETNLAVFAHRLRTGPRKGKIALIIYGLKAYHDYSELMERELARFEKFERALREGAVIERIIDADNRSALPALAFEPSIRVGADAEEKVFAPLLATLLERRRVDRYQALGLRPDSLVASTTDYNGELVEVDRFNSSFIYRRGREGATELVKMTSLASLEQIRTELAKADAQRALAETRRKVAAGEEGALVTLNSVREKDGLREIGPVLSSSELPDWLKKGATGGKAALDKIFGMLEELPPLERARLAYNNYASTAVSLDLLGNGQKQPVFITVEFPPGRAARTSTNRSNGKIERVLFENGRAMEVISQRNIVLFKYSETGAELETQTFWNAGTFEAPRKGPLQESTRTLQVWRGDLADPYAPLISKLRLNHITGETKVETYGLFDEPIEIVDENFITTQRFDEQGRLLEAVTAENGLTDADFQRPLSEKLARPIRGDVRFRARGKTDRATTQTQSGIIREDMAQGLSRTVILDELHSGRTVQENFTDEHGFEIHYSYDDEWWLGRIPEKAVVQSAESRKVLREIRYIEFDPATRRLTGVETDYRGTVSTQTWDHRWTAPIETETALRKTTVTYDRRGLTGRGQTIDKASGEVIRGFSVTWNPTERSWQSIEQWWHSPGARLRVETNWLSGFGRLLRADSAEIFRAIPDYDSNGHEIGRRVLRRHPQTGNYDIVQRIEDDYRWDGGSREARVRIWVDGDLYDEHRSRSDAEGRLVATGIRTNGAINLRTELTYDLGTERRLESSAFQNGNLRSRQQFSSAYLSNGVWFLPAVTTPAWGLATTNFYRLDEPLGRAQQIALEDGASVRVLEWFDGTAIPKLSERIDRHGRITERSTTQLRAGNEGAFAFDVSTHDAISPWGDAGFAQRRALLSGTDILVFNEAADERTYFDTTKPFEAPLYSRKSGNAPGLNLSLQGTALTNLSKIFRAATNAADQRLVIHEIDLRGFFSKSFSRKSFDRAGNLLEERTGSFKRAPETKTAESLFEDLSNAPPARVFSHQFEAGAWVAGADAWRFTNSPAIINDGQRDAVTRIEARDASAGTNQLRSLSVKQILRHNPWLAHLRDSWTEWTTTDGLEPGGSPFESVVVYNAQGLPVVTRAKKSGAEKIAIQIPSPAAGEWRETNGTIVRIPLALTNVSRAYFIYFFLLAGDATPVVNISDGKSVVTPIYWSASSGSVLWSPNENDPQEGVTISSASSERLVAIPVAALATGQIDLSALRTMTLRFPGASPGRLRYTAPELILRVAKDGEFRPKLARSYQEIAYSSGLRSVIQKTASGGWRASLLWNGNPVVNAFQREALQAPRLIVTDLSQPHSPQPLYALEAEDGSFFESYRVFKAPGQTRVYSSASGLESPRLEVFRAAEMLDELRPGMVAYGRDLPVVITPKGSPSESGPTLEMRLQASAWKQVGDRAFGFDADPANPGEELLLLNNTYDAGLHARQIEGSPLLAEALLPFRAVPWPADAATESPIVIQTNAIALRLQQLALGRPTGLIPTAPGSDAEQFVETVAEAELIQLAMAVGAGSLAIDILNFYWDHSSGGTEPIFDWYDASTGASVFKSPQYKRPIDASRAARAQLGIAEAALRVNAAYGDTNAFRLGKNLLELLLRRYRVEQAPGLFGIVEEIGLPQRSAFGLPLLPPARRFLLGTNARFYILLREISGRFFATDPAFQVAIEGALRDQERWLRVNFLDRLAAESAIPRGIFEVQDAKRGSSAYAPERITSSDDWLALLEASNLIGLSKATNRVWLENLARAHGAQVGSNWGLDWTIPWRRPEAISARLTAKFLRAARELEHPQAAAFASAHLARMVRPKGDIAGLLTTAAPDAPFPTGLGVVVFPDTEQSRWPSDLAAYSALLGKSWLTNQNAVPLRALPPQARDMSAFFWTATLAYFAILATAIFWWLFHHFEGRRKAVRIESLLSAAVMQQAEERWAKRVLGVQTPSDADRTRFSNAAVEANFHMQLRAIYKIVLEWRRLENGWSENDPRLVEEGSDPWLNGADEFAAMIGIYSRFVVKAGKKDGRSKADPFEENEDSNHLWSRLVLYFSEYLWGLLQLLKQFKANPEAARIFGINDQFEAVLRTMGLRARRESFDARGLFDFPANPGAMDLLRMQLPGATLTNLAEQMEKCLRIPRTQFRTFLKNYKTFKYREQVYPVHPYIIEASKLFPHFILMGLVAVIWYNQDVNGLLIFPFLKQLALGMVQSRDSLWWGIPLVLGAGFAVAAKYVHSYRYTGAIRSRKKQHQVLDEDVGSFFAAQQSALPSIRQGWPWDPVWYERVGWVLRGTGLVGLALFLMDVNAPSLATFTLIKGLFVPILFAEAAAILLPLLITFFSEWLEDRVSAGQSKSRFARFINQLNLTPTRPASILWLGFKYHFQSSVPSGGAWSMARCILFYFLFTSAFFLIGSYSFKEVLRVWFAQRFHQGWDWELAIGSVIFWNTMYLLRFGLFVFLVTAASFIVTFPLQAIALTTAVILALSPSHPAMILVAFIFVGLCLVPRLRDRFTRKDQKVEKGLEDLRIGAGRSLAVVYMSGDDLSSLKLTPELLLNRLQILRDKLGSTGAKLLIESMGISDEAALTSAWGRLHALEKKQGVTLWHPLQLLAPGDTPRFDESSGLHLVAESNDDRQFLLKAWQIRRWLVTMMSTAGHGQDTAINLVDIALRLTEEELSRSTAFYLIQNKYDNNDNNRPSQIKYGEGELAHRNKLAHLLMQLAPGSRAYNINDWTPFGFKAGGLVGMDFIHEESLNLSNMLVLDRNANTNDLSALMADLKGALADPGVIIVVPGRSTTNALTPLGQASQSVEEGHRAMIKGLMAVGGGSGEAVGTGWGNIQAIHYGRVQQALLDPESPKMPLTSRMRRGSAFHEESHGMIGFGPHAVGISEDVWGVTQAAHNAIALGQTVKFRGSKAFWHKIRETWSHAEWFSAFPRWSGGYLQMMLDPIMQKISDGGPLSVFAKEIRASGGRFFLSAPFALLNILLMPLAIIWDVSPFVQILVGLWLFGLLMNQALTMLGAVATLEATGFLRVPALLGAAVFGVLFDFSPAAILFGCVSGGFSVGLSKWLFHRGRDLILFGPQLVIHALGQVIRQSLEFVLSGASVDDAKGVNIAFRGWVGPREDRPWESYANMINLRTVIWGVGLLSLILNIFALAKLDFLNALLLLPSLFFSISALIGPFLMAPKPGSHSSFVPVIAKIGGWLGGALYFVLLGGLLGRGGWAHWIGLAIAGMTLFALASAGLRYLGYPWRLRRGQGELSSLLEKAGLPGAEAHKLAQETVRVFQGDSARLQSASKLEPAGLTAVLDYNERVLKPLIKKPMMDVHTRGLSRGISEFKRSLTLSLFTLFWFLLVPIPGLLVFTGLGYRFSLPLPNLIQFVFGLIGAILLAYGISRVWDKAFFAARIRPRHNQCYARLQKAAPTLSASELSTLYGLLMDALTFSDQLGFAYAMQRLDEADQILRIAESRASSTGSATSKAPGQNFPN